ncbi:unnamed protein product [Fusarium graminearum]|uniref:Chromosome 2, complete genome n=1 Tax=Gibberella zeae (strain ATCC MYA-4620 / CBS 123657 / FGSC 9075 / NRRL 31084 / PH-1) TaxID=229533 RepID=A0A098DFC7_GIBZE|nr:unnamed protein product [Fusarium graminearum]
MGSSSSGSGVKTRSTTSKEHQSNDGRTKEHDTGQGSKSKLGYEVLTIARSLRVITQSDSAGRSKPQRPPSHILLKPPRFGDLSPYGINDDDEKYLWELEVARLIDSLDETQEPLSSSHNHVLPSAIDTLGFDCLEKLSDQMLCALSIYGIDDTMAIAASSIDSIGDRSFNKLQERLGARPEPTHVVRARERVSYEPNYMRYAGNNTAPMVQEKPVPGESIPLASVNDDDAPAYYVLVDYITATLARLILKGFDERQVYWISIIVTTIAKISTKLKVLSHSLPAFGNQSLDRFSVHRRNYWVPTAPALDNPHPDHPPFRNGIRGITTGSSDSYVVNYVSDMASVSTWLFRFIWHILTDLNTRNTRGRSTDEFETSATIFAMGSRNLPTLAYQNRPGHISGSSSIIAVAMYQRAFDLIMDAVKIINENSVAHVQASRNQCTLSIGMKKSFPDQSFRISSMTDIVSIMVVISCMDPSLTEDMVKVCSKLRASTVLPRVSTSVQEYAAFVSLSNLPVQSNSQPLQNSRPLSQSFILHSGNRVLSSLRDRHDTSSRWNFTAVARKELHKSESMRRQVSLSARGWAVEEQAISVSCLKYTVSVMAGCSILVLGGLMAGFFVGSRIDGVDPFNITMFAWIIAGFIILVSKSLRVGEWTWRDFLKGRVTCRSVHELASVTNIDEQGIIMQLLSSEKEWPLILRGPYNSAFSNTGAEGFSIDVKPNIGTLFVSGLLVLEVLMESGPALVCLDLRPQVTAGEGDDSANGDNHGNMPVRVSKNRMVHGQRTPFYALACKNVPQRGEAEKDIVFRQQLVTWEKVIGLYNNPDQSVR